MAHLKCCGVSHVLSQYSFKIDSDSKQENLTCTLCKKLMIDACQSAICGCRYCHRCVVAYLEDGDKYCPGERQECNDGTLVLSRDIFRNPRCDKKICNVRVHCPNNWCSARMELNVIEDHLRVCEQSMECPFLNIGCTIERAPKQDIITHLSRDVLPHANLLIDWIRNLKNEIDGLKNCVEKNKLETSSVSEESRLKDERIEKLSEQVSMQRREIESVKVVLKEKENRISTLEDQFKLLKDNIESRLSAMKDDRQTETLECGIDFIRKDVRKYGCSMTNVVARGVVNNMTREYKYDEGRIKHELKKMCTNIRADFVWRINELSKKVETMRWTRIYSKSFYSNNYKFCLYLNIVSDNIYLYCMMMMGDNDDTVEWPMRRPVTLGIINQDTMRIHNSDIYKYDTYKCDKSRFDRPQSDMNSGGIGYYPFIHYSSIKDNPSIIIDDSVIVSCGIGDL